MITEAQIGKMFKKWYRQEYLMTSDHTTHDPYSEKAFKAAISLMLPIIEKLQEVVDHYDPENDENRTYLDIFDCITRDNDSVTSFDSAKFGSVARQIKLQVEQLLKSLGG